MARRLLVAALLLSILAPAPTAVAAWPVDEFAPVVEALEDSADGIAGTTVGLAENTLALAGTIVGPGLGLLAIVDTALGALGAAGGAVEAEFIAEGEGTATMLIHSVNGDIHGSCADMRAVVEYHEPYSNENTLYFNAFAGQGAPAMACTNGWSGALQPGEVQGDLESGLVGTSRSIDANIDLYVGPLRPDGTRVFWIRQVTYPSGIGDVLEFSGRIVEVL